MFFVVIVLFLLSSNNLDFSLNMISLRFFISRLTKKFNSLSLDLRFLGGTILRLKNTWQYLGFFFNRKLLFQYYTYYYANKVLSTIKSMKILGNLTRGLSPVHK